MTRISNKWKLGAAILLLLVLAGLLLFNDRREAGGVDWRDGKELLSVFLSETDEQEVWEERFDKRKDSRMTYLDLMELAELFAKQNLIKKEALVTLEQQLSQWGEKGRMWKRKN